MANLHWTGKFRGVAAAAGLLVFASAAHPQDRPPIEEFSDIVRQLTSNKLPGVDIEFRPRQAAVPPDKCRMTPSDMVVRRGAEVKAFPVLVARKGRAVVN